MEEEVQGEVYFKFNRISCISPVVFEFTDCILSSVALIFLLP